MINETNLFVKSYRLLLLSIIHAYFVCGYRTHWLVECLHISDYYGSLSYILVCCITTAIIATKSWHRLLRKFYCACSLDTLSTCYYQDFYMDHNLSTSLKGERNRMGLCWSICVIAKEVLTQRKEPSWEYVEQTWVKCHISFVRGTCWTVKSNTIWSAVLQPWWWRRGRRGEKQHVPLNQVGMRDSIRGARKNSASEVNRSRKGLAILQSRLFLMELRNMLLYSGPVYSMFL